MLPVEQPMDVLQGECRLADAPQADQGLGDHDWAHKGRMWKGAGCAPFTGRVEELAWLRQAAGVPQRRKDSTSQPPTKGCRMTKGCRTAPRGRPAGFVYWRQKRKREEAGGFLSHHVRADCEGGTTQRGGTHQSTRDRFEGHTLPGPF